MTSYGYSGTIIWNPYINNPNEPAGVDLSSRATERLLEISNNQLGQTPEEQWRNALTAVSQVVQETQSMSRSDFNRMHEQHVRDSRGLISNLASGTANRQIAALYASTSRGLIIGANVNPNFLISAGSNSHIIAGRRLEHVRELDNYHIPHTELLMPAGMVFWIGLDPRIAILITIFGVY